MQYKSKKLKMRNSKVNQKISIVIQAKEIKKNQNN